MHPKKFHLLELLIVFIITIPAFLSLLNTQYFQMHDDQHIARLFLLDQGIRQRELYPRFVDTLGFNFGYPLFNFYPPFIYYLAEGFHLLGFSFVWSMKLVAASGFVIGAWGMYFFAKKFVGVYGGILASTLYTFFTYHAVLLYVRGAIAEFFALSLLPFVFLTLYTISQKIRLQTTLLFGIILALLVLTHPLIALPSLIFIGLFFMFPLFREDIDGMKYFIHCLSAGAIGLGLSAFFWLPSLIERKFTLVDSILTRELANYQIHFIYPGQFLYSPWGYGGSIAGPVDGLSFQLGRFYIGLLLLSVPTGIIYLIKQKKFTKELSQYLFFIFLLGVSLFMATDYSRFIWDNIRQLWYLQFPWRFLTFTTIFIAISASYFIYFLEKTIKIPKAVLLGGTVLVIGFVTMTYQKYFFARPLVAGDSRFTSFYEIAWRVSRTSFEFAPLGIKTKQSELNTTIPDIKSSQITKETALIVHGSGTKQQLTNEFAKKEFRVNAITPIQFRLNTFNFPGWAAYMDGKRLPITDQNDFKLIAVDIPKGEHNLTFRFKNTPIRNIANGITVATLFGLLVFVGTTSARKFNRISDPA